MTRDEAEKATGHTPEQLNEIECGWCGYTALEIFTQCGCPQDCNLKEKAAALKSADIENLI